MKAVQSILVGALIGSVQGSRRLLGDVSGCDQGDAACWCTSTGLVGGYADVEVGCESFYECSPMEGGSIRVVLLD